MNDKQRGFFYRSKNEEIDEADDFITIDDSGEVLFDKTPSQTALGEMFHIYGSDMGSGYLVYTNIDGVVRVKEILETMARTLSYEDRKEALQYPIDIDQFLHMVEL